MIVINNKEDCCGCTACASICPQKCISMRQDKEGFCYPFVQKDKCVDCHLCEKVCPVRGKLKTVAILGKNKAEVNRASIDCTEPLPQAFACFLKDEDLRFRSTSGGVFTALALHTFDKDGIVCGVVLDQKCRAIHAFAKDKSELDKMRGSKYVQSDQTGIYSRIKSELQQGRVVLYSGTPCQVEGLKSYLGKEYDNLLTVDVFCHGVGSPLYWKKYIDYITQNAHSAIKRIYFREKTYGYNSGCLAVYFENGKCSRKGHDDDLYWSAFSKNIIYRPSCYACAFKKIHHRSDFSIGDFWGSDKLPEKYAKANGCSLVLCHSKNALDILQSISIVEKTEVDLRSALDINGGHQPSMLIACPQVPTVRKEWFQDINNLNAKQMVDKYLPLTLQQRVKCMMKPVLYKVGLLEVLKKYKRVK